MKILPIAYNIISNVSNRSLDQQSPLPHFSTGHDTFEMTFTGGNSYLKPLMNSNNIHCPCCGIKMLSENSYQELLNKASNIRSTGDFITLLTENKESIPKSMQSILENSATEYEDSMLEFHKYFLEKNRACSSLHATQIETANKYLLEIAQRFPEENSKKIIDLVKTFDLSDTAYVYKDKLLRVIDTLNLEPKDKFLILKNVTSIIQDSSDYLSIFKIPNFSDMSIQELAAALAQKIFRYSVIQSSKVSKIMDDFPNNEILSCSKCERSASKRTFLSPVTLDNPEFKNYLMRYLNDVSFNSGQENYENNKSYIHYLINFIERISKQKISFDNMEVGALLKIGRIASRHQEFAPIVQTKIDIPCAGCGSTLLPHNVKKIIDSELLHCNSVKEYTEVLKKYDKYIGVYAREAADLYLKIVEQNPNISKTKLVSRLQREMDKISASEAHDILRLFSKIRPSIAENNTFAELAKYDLISKKIYDYIISGKFNDYNYQNLSLNLVHYIDINNDTPSVIYTILNKLRIISYKNSLVKPNEFDLAKDKDSVQTILFNLFKSDLGTADHFLAATKGGNNTKDNIIGLCRTCNTVVKGKKKVPSWIGQNPEVRIHLPEHLSVVDKMSKDGVIEGYDTWAKSIADALYELTYNKFDIRDKF